MRYLLKSDVAEMILDKYKNSYLVKELNLCESYVSLILHRKKSVTKRTANDIRKLIDTNAEITDMFDIN